MSFNIPDTITKFSLLASVVAISFFHLEYKELDRLYDKYVSEADSLNVEINKESYKLYISKLVKAEKGRMIARNYNIESPITFSKKDSTLNFSYLAAPKYTNLNRLVFEEWSNHTNDKLNFNNKMKYIDYRSKLIYEESDELIKEMNRNTTGSIMLAGLIMFAIFAWTQEDNLKNLKKQSERVYESCQSCGNEINSVRINGTNIDGSQNLAFCKSCFDNGSFNNPNLTSSEALKELKEKKNSRTRFSDYFLKRKVNNLERWK